MSAEVEQADGSFVDEDRVPVCGENFCDSCGDCLHCYGGDPCYPHGEPDGPHRWIIYLRDAKEQP